MHHEIGFLLLSYTVFQSKHFLIKVFLLSFLVNGVATILSIAEGDHSQNQQCLWHLFNN